MSNHQSPAEGASAVPSDADIEWPDIDALAHSAAQEAYSFGISHDLFKRWMTSAMFKTASAIRAAIIAKQETAQPDVQPKGTEGQRHGDRWLHKKSGGEYEWLGHAKVQTDTPLEDMATVVFYKGADGRVWMRPTEEFRERFERVSAADQAPAPAHKAEELVAFEEWRNTLHAANLDGKRDLVWRHIAGAGFEAGAAWARSQAPAVTHQHLPGDAE